MATTSQFTTIRSEGAVLPADLLTRVRDNDRALAGLRSEDYHLPTGERFNEAITRSWNRLLGSWTAFREQRERMPEHDPATTLTRERWLLPLIDELDYGRLPTTRAIEIEGKSYPISHGWGEHVPIHLVGAGIDLDRRAAGVAGAARMSPHGLLQELLNRSDSHLWGIVSNGLRLRILRDSARLTRQAYVEFDLQAMFDGEIYADFVLLWLLCHQSRFEPGLPAPSREAVTADEDEEGEGAEEVALPTEATPRPELCWLERWSRTAAESGARALDDLRGGVEAAIVALGSGFIGHKENGRLREQLRDGTLTERDLYPQLLRMIYRLLFLFVAEDRGLLLDPGATTEAARRYREYYSTERLRRMAGKRRGTRHADLWQGLALVMRCLGDDSGAPPLGLPALGSALWSAKETEALEGCELANRDLLDAIRALSFIQREQVQRTVDYRNLGAEELGSVYESLLELHPRVELGSGTLTLATAGGNERKTTGSYYTPSSLINELLDSALDPVVEERLRAAGADSAAQERALLELKVVDPACGSGHFLVAAAHRIARRLAAVRTGDEEPAPEATRAALRAVIGRCIYGVDLNPLAVELCKVSLWLEAMEPGRPLGFLDHHIQCGNSLIGATPALLARGIPDDAFQPLIGDDKTAASAIRKRNRQERAGQQRLDLRMTLIETPEDLRRYFATLERVEETLEDVHAKERAYGEFQRDRLVRHERIRADLWTAAFFWPLRKGAPEPPTDGAWRRLLRDPNLLTYLTAAGRERYAGTSTYETTRHARHIASRLRTFHWHLAFPDVFRVPTGNEQPENEATGWSGGFDVVLGNPPWERIKLQEKEFFAERRPDIANAPNAAVRKRLIAALETEDPPLFRAFQEALRQADGESQLIRESGRYPLTGRGDVNTYALFAESNRMLLAPTGRFGCIVPTGIATDATTQFFFRDLMETGTLASLYDLENREAIFPTIHRSFKFCLLTIAGADRPARSEAKFVFFALQPEDLRDDWRSFTLSAADLALLNPNTRTCPIFRSKRDAELTKAIYRRVPVLIEEGPPEKNPWGIAFLRMFDMTNDSHLFRAREELEARGCRLEGNVFDCVDEKYLPLYEAKMVDFYDHRAAEVVISATAMIRQGQPSELSGKDKESPSRLPLPRTWIAESEVVAVVGMKWSHQWFVGWRDITSGTNERTFVPCLTPFAAIGNKIPCLLANSTPFSSVATGLQSNLSSLAFDYTTRQKIGSITLNYFIVNQLPMLPPSTHDQPAKWLPWLSNGDWLLPRVLELTYTAWDLEAFGRDCGYAGPPFRWDDARRFLLRCEIDAAYFHLYGIERDDVDYIMDTFPIVRRKDIKAHGEYRAKRVIQQMYDEMAEAMRTGVPYQTHLDPPPADPRVAHSPDTRPAWAKPTPP